MASLTGTKIKDTYDGLLKTTDNGVLGASAKLITDGLGNSSGVYLGTAGIVGIGTPSPSRTIHLKADTPSIRFEDSTGNDYAELVSVNGDLYVRADESNTEANSNIRFQIDQSEKMRILSSGGLTFNGDTAAANALDDYEEGNFTPVVADAASGGNEAATASTYASYTKVGRLCLLTMVFNNIDTTGLTAGNDIYITDLPFSMGDVTGSQFAIGNLEPSALTFSGIPQPRLQDNTQYLRIFDSTSGNNSSALTISDIASGTCDLRITISYHTQT